MNGWIARAECIGPDPRRFDERVSDETDKSFAERFEGAVAYCNRCPVKKECGQAAAEDKASGIRAGSMWSNGKPIRTPFRAKVRKRHVPKLPRVIDYQPCGTHAAYSRHRRMSQQPCKACSAAESVYRRKLRDAKVAA